MTSLASVFVDGRIDTSRFGSDIRSGMSSSSVRSAATTSSKTLGGHFKSGFGSALRGFAAPITAALGAVAVGSFFKGAIDEATDAAKVGARTAGVIKSTGGAANVTRKQIEDLATSISNKAAIDDEAIQSGANLLLTFKNIRNEAGKGNDVFNQATQVVTDLSVGMGQSLKSSAVQVGKALNDPIKGVSALSRVGVTFDDVQKRQIQRFVESGKTMKAQKIILAELNSEFGGAAASAATPAEKAQVAWGNFKEQVGTALLPVLGKLATWFTSVALPALSKFAAYIQTVIVPAISKFVVMVVGWFHQADESSGGFRDGIERLKDGILNFVADATPVVRSIIDYFISMWPQIKPTIDAFVAGIKSAIELITTIIQTEVKIWTFIWDHFGKFIVDFLKSTFANVVTVLRGVFKVIGGIFKLFSDLLKGNWGQLWDDVKQILSGVVDILKGLVGQIWTDIKFAFRVGKEIVAGLFRAMWEVIKDLVSHAATFVFDAVYGMWQDLKEVTSGAVESIWQTIRGWAADVVDLMLGFAETFLNLADKAFGWIPGLGGKLDDAKAAFANFRDDVNNYLRGIEDQHVTVSGSFNVPSQAQIAKVTAQLGGIPSANGRLVTGGIPGKDSVPLLTMPGEFLHKKAAVDHYGVPFMRALNNMQIPKFEDGGLVVDTVTDSAGAKVTAGIASRIMSRIASLLGAGMSRSLDGIVGDLRPPAFGGVDLPGGRAGATISAVLQKLSSWVGSVPYVWGGASLAGMDCSGAQSVVTNMLRGAGNPFYRLGSTASMPWAGFLPGPGNYSVGWTTNYGGSGIGHTAGTLGGVNVESAGGIGLRMGSAARGAFDSGFSHIMHLSGFDTGGKWSTGTLGYNTSGHDEYVATTRMDLGQVVDAIQRLMRMLDERGLKLRDPGVLDGRAAAIAGGAIQGENSWQRTRAAMFQ